jgi:hypothetical protein
VPFLWRLVDVQRHFEFSHRRQWLRLWRYIRYPLVHGSLRCKGAGILDSMEGTLCHHIACSIWGSMLSQKLLVIYCDNLGIVHCVNSGSSKCPHIMELVRLLFSIACKYNFGMRLRHIAGVLNVGPDLLSRLELPRFRVCFPSSDASGTCVPSIELLCNL